MPVDGFWRKQMNAGHLLTILMLAACPCALALPPVKSPAATTQAVSASASSRNITASAKSKDATTGATSAQASAQKQTHGLMQFSMNQHLIGDCTVLIGPEQIAIRVHKSDLIFCLRKPYKTVTTYCRQTGKRHESDVAHFINPFSKSQAFLSGAIYKDIPMIKTGQKQVLGLKTETYMASKAYSADIRSRYLRREVSGSQPEKCLGSYLPFKADAPILNLANAMLAIPEVKHAICLEMDMEELGNEKIKYLSTSKVSNIKASEQILKQFEVPSGLKLVKHIEEVIQNESAGDAIKMMMDSDGSH